ncbi:MAG: ATP-binding protein [Phycisphaerales bacterium]
MLILTVIQGPDKGKTYELPDNEPQLLGRSSEALPLTDNTVSRRHAELTPDEGEWWIRDLGSQNGTWVNGVRIGDRTKLKLGDQIRSGQTLFVFGKSTSASGTAKIRLLRPGMMDTNFERTLPSNEDSVILAEPEPRQAAVDHLRVIYRVTTLTTRLSTRQELLDGVMDLIFAEVRPERGFVLRVGDDEPENPAPAVVRFSDDSAARDAERFAVPRTIVQHALRRGEAVLSSNAMNDARFKAGDSVQHLAVRSAICSPIRFIDRTFGAIYIDSSMANYTFTAEQLALMTAIGQQTGLALANAELYAQKLQSERLAAMGETVASLSHSIKNILQGLRGGADVVEMGLKRSDLKIATGGWGILKRNLDRIISLTMNMLAYSRPRTLEIELTRLPNLLNDCAQLLVDVCAAREIALIIDAETDMPPLPIDPGQMHQALMNLITNAVEAVEAKVGVVTVRVSYKAEPARPGQPARAEARIVVVDNGPGIPAEKQPRIFEPFFTTKGMRGTGLGLAVTRRIVDQHGGRIELDSSPGKGARFSVVLPIDPGAMIDPSETAHSRGGPSQPLR